MIEQTTEGPVDDQGQDESAGLQEIDERLHMRPDAVASFRRWLVRQKPKPRAVFVSEAVYDELVRDSDRKARSGPGRPMGLTMLIIYGVSIWSTKSPLPKTFWPAPEEFQNVLGSALRYEVLLNCAKTLVKILEKAADGL